MSTSTKIRGRQNGPTRAEVAAAYERLRIAAISGSVQANAALIALAERRLLLSTEVFVA
ncbi:hypothetical protein PMI22_00482 [Pseudomonas sp. GM21]|jgi:hypothetical protein|nr:hypothetical protein PMI22_00482 [Pseudomonas sp. GM21]